MALAGDSGYLPPIRYVFRFRRNVNSDSSGDRRDAGRRHYCQCSAGIFWFSVYIEVNSGLSRAEAICKDLHGVSKKRDHIFEGKLK